MTTQNHGASIKDDDQYEALRNQGVSKEKAARIANTSRHAVGEKGGHSPKYEQWTKKDLYKKAAEVDVHGRSSMDKGELIDALRHH